MRERQTGSGFAGSEILRAKVSFLRAGEPGVRQVLEANSMPVRQLLPKSCPTRRASKGPRSTRGVWQLVYGSAMYGNVWQGICLALQEACQLE